MPDEREPIEPDPAGLRPWPEMGQRERWQFFKRIVDRMQPMSMTDESGALGRRSQRQSRRA